MKIENYKLLKLIFESNLTYKLNFPSKFKSILNFNNSRIKLIPLFKFYFKIFFKYMHIALIGIK